ncbi:MAG: chemotaxis protein CheW [Thermaerobacter sp.]|nr:chemotaxis protein CheW [Thermaerobacter sp.]
MSQDLQLVIFALDREYYGIETRLVTEISRLEALTFVPRTAKHIAGVVNLRGKITPVICLRARLGLPPRVDSKETRIIFVEVEEVLVGLVVDAVLEVSDIAAALITAPPAVISAPFVLGVCHYKQQNAEHSARVTLDALVQQEKNAIALRLSEMQGQVKLLAELPLWQTAANALATAELFTRRSQLRAIENIAITDLTGHSLVNTAHKPLDLSKRKYVHKSLTGAPAHEIVVSAVDGGIILAVSEPLRSPQGHVTGVILMTTDLSKDQSLEFAPFGQTGERYLVDRNGHFITKSRFMENAVLLRQAASAPALDLFVDKSLPSFFGRYLNYRQHEVYGAMNYLAALDVVVVAEQEVVETTGEILVVLLDPARLFTQELTARQGVIS